MVKSNQLKLCEIIIKLCLLFRSRYILFTFQESHFDTFNAFQVRIVLLKLKFRKYPAIHTNYSLLNYTISN